LGPKSESLSLRRSLSAEILGILFDEGRREASGSCDSELWALANKFVIDSGEILVFFSSCQLFSPLHYSFDFASPLTDPARKNNKLKLFKQFVMK
jgi:hypothetical protein